MTQVKIFDDVVTSSLENEVNEFLNENNGKIKVCDIKLSSHYNGHLNRIYALVIYETIE